MSGLPHPFEAPGDALPNRTGGGVTVREAIHEMLWDTEKRCDVELGGYECDTLAKHLAPIIERALDILIDKMVDYYAITVEMAPGLHERFHARFVAAMTERDSADVPVKTDPIFDHPAADAPPEPTEEMVEAMEETITEVLRFLQHDIRIVTAHGDRWRNVFRAALAAAPPSDSAPPNASFPETGPWYKLFWAAWQVVHNRVAGVEAKPDPDVNALWKAVDHFTGPDACHPAHPEDAPGGPYHTHHDVGKDEDESEWYVQNMKNGVIEFSGTETQCDGGRDVLNRIEGVEMEPSVVYRVGRPTYADYNEAIWALRDACSQLEPDGRSCTVCHDGGHQAWECHHNPLTMARRFAGVTDVWKCFHCGVVFTNEQVAREHFGTNDEEVARCLVDRLKGDPADKTTRRQEER